MAGMDPPAYTPVACALHERLEFAVLRRLRLDLEWSDGAGRHCARVLPLDVTTRDGAEWLIFQPQGGEAMTIRLDRILSLSELAPGSA